MMIGLALCVEPGNDYHQLYQMPRFCEDIKKGDTVIVDAKQGRQQMRVVETSTVDVDSEVFKMLCAATRATLPLKKVLKRCAMLDLEYVSTELHPWGHV